MASERSSTCKSLIIMVKLNVQEMVVISLPTEGEFSLNDFTESLLRNGAINWEYLSSVPGVEVVDEPGHSRRELLALQREYGITTREFYEAYQNGVLLVDPSTAACWAYYYEIFREAGGNPAELEGWERPQSNPFEDPEGSFFMVRGGR